jgi:SAM-dependent methyltransferase
MDKLRKTHNMYKSQLITRCVFPGQNVLDCGCGHGGDFGKWKRAGVKLTAIDPDEKSLLEASNRAKSYNLDVILLKGDILSVAGTFDAICYNFSIHYIFDSLEKSSRALARKLKPGGLLFGIVPDSDRMKNFTDNLGNSVRIVDGKAEICLIDGPFYSGTTRTEPLICKSILETFLSKWFDCIEWGPMCDMTGLISDIYSRFIFRRK